MRVLEYSDLDTSGVEAQYLKVIEMLKRDDFYSAEVKKLGPGDYYRARLDHTNRLLFTLRRHNGERHALVLEVIRNHAYDKSRFLRGARIDEGKVLSVEQAPAAAMLPALKFVNPATARFHFLDKAISFDGTQQAILGLPAPLIVIGSAGSGKTALTLERMKLVQGDVLYATLSSYLAQNARNLYFAHGYDNENQNIDFLSFRELLETFRVPTGREVTYGAFKSWFARHRQNYKFADAHKLFEEFHGVLTGAEIETPRLARDAYLALGVRQSIFPAEERPAVYDLFEKYLAFLDENGLYDSNLLAHRYFELCGPRYDFAVVDEVQDLTNVQLALVLRTLRNSGDFILCGDSNQIVHPNFFSWAKVKTLFYKAEWLEAKRVMHVLRTNYRNAEEITAVANRLLKLKQRRFGSIDRESTYLVESVPENRGEVQLLPDRDKLKRELDEKTRNSARFAVLVMRDEDKPAAREHFRTPLLFSIHEAKGLEYDNVILCNFVSNDRAAFSHIAGDVSAAELEQELAYARAKDKTDKSLEVYKFFVNAFYVAITRAVKNLYVLESDTAHALLRLIGLEATRERVDMTAQSSTREEWQREARRLELQGKEEQADAIRREILRVRPVPWSVLTRERYLELLDRALDRREVSKKPRQQLLEYGAVLDDHSLFPRLASAGYEQATHREKLAIGMRKKHLGEYESKNPKAVLRSAETYGVDFRNPFNLTPLMCAAMQGNVVLAQALLDRGANPELTDNHGRTALHLALLRAYTDSRFAATRLGDLYPLLTPASVSVRARDRLIKIDGHTIEFFLFHSMIALFHRRISSEAFCYSGFATGDFVDSIRNFPENTLAGYRKRRQYLSGVLARNEVSRDYPYNRRLFVRLRQGYYALNPQLSVRVGEDWVNIQQHLGQSLIEAHGEESIRVFFARVDNAIARAETNCGALEPPSAGPKETEPAAPAASSSSRNQGEAPGQPLSGETRPAQLDLFGN